MSVRSRINELIDCKNLEDAIKTVEHRRQEITTGDLLSLYSLMQKLLDNKQPIDVISVLRNLEHSPVFLSTSDFCSILKGLLRTGPIELSKSLLLYFLEKNVINESQSSLIFIESATYQKEFDAACDIISQLSLKKIPLNERFWESAISYFDKNDAVVHSARCFKLMTLPALKSKRIWEDFLTACIKSHEFLIAFSTVYEIALSSDKSVSCEL